MKEQTDKEYRNLLEECQNLFVKKASDYGTSWRIMRLSSITDQIMIKARRIRSIQEKGTQKVPDSIREEFIGIINYCVMALVQIHLQDGERLELEAEEVQDLYKIQVSKNRELLDSKNHDYDEAWRDMRVSSITDIILMKLLRIKQIEDNQNQTLVSEGVESGYRDIINYSVFALILLKGS